jgi:hypothetical protein
MIDTLLSMYFFPNDRNVPDFLEGEDFILLPLTTAQVQIDYEAVMASKEMLRLWSGSTWPREGFTLAENLADLAWHQQEHQDRQAFTFTVLDVTQEVCLGCVYIRPLTDLVAANPGVLVNIGEDEAIVRFWVRTSHLGCGLDRRLLKALAEWFAAAWPFSRYLFHTRRMNAQQVALFEKLPLQRELELQYAKRGGTHYFYGMVPNS